MVCFIVAIGVGILCIVLGIFNMRGNINSLHSYHRKNVSEEDRLPFGKKVGLGTIIMGASIVVCGGASIATLLTEKQIFSTVGMILMAIGLVVGLCISFFAIKKYNKTIF